MRTKLYIVALFSFVFSLISCNDTTPTSNEDNSLPVKVKLNTITLENNDSFLSASGKIEAVKSSNLSTRMMGFVDKIYVTVGSKVNKGQLLLRINSADISAKLAQVNAGITEATVAFNNAEKDYNRFTILFNDNSASQKELDDITAGYNMAKARLEASKQLKSEVNAQLAYTNIRAPFSGIITNKFINAGDMANPAMPLLEVEAPGNFQVIALLPESEISQIKKDTKVNVIVKSLGKTVKGKVVEISTSAKNTGGQYLVKIALDKTPVKLLSGMFATTHFPIKKSSTSTALLIPAEAIVNKGQLTGIYTVSQSNTALLRWLRLGRVYGDQIEVLSGLNSDESYIISAEGKLYNGAKISIQ
jgi:RND family efflux transporter MFP subunit